MWVFLYLPCNSAKYRFHSSVTAYDRPVQLSTRFVNPSEPSTFCCRRATEQCLVSLGSSSKDSQRRGRRCSDMCPPPWSRVFYPVDFLYVSPLAFYTSFMGVCAGNAVRTAPVSYAMVLQFSCVEHPCPRKTALREHVRVLQQPVTGVDSSVSTHHDVS